MNIQSVLESRLAIRKRHGMPLLATEFAFLGDRAFVVNWRVHSVDGDRVHINEQHLVDARFNVVAGRMAAIVERYYDELDLRSPSPRFHWENVKQALLLSSGCLSATSQWFEVCTAPPNVIEDIFTVVRNSMGEIGKSEEVLREVAIERVAEATIREMDRRRRLAGCIVQRIVA